MTPAADEIFTLTNSAGTVLRFTSLGGTVLSLHTNDRNGALADITPGFDTVDEYRHDNRYFGAIVGRVANRIANARFDLFGKSYALAANNGSSHLHGGDVGFHNVPWTVTPFAAASGNGAALDYVSIDGEAGYPGTLRIRVTYTLTESNAFVIEYHAVTDKPTPINLTQHIYFNLKGHDRGDILGHELALNASRYTPVNEQITPTGKIAPVANTPFDFTSPHIIGARIDAAHEQLELAGGYDHNWVIDGENAELKFAARLREPETGRVVQVYTTEPGIQFYAGNMMASSRPGKSGNVYARRSALALETQHFPDAPNQPTFPSIILHPGDAHTSRTEYRFSTY